MKADMWQSTPRMATAKAFFFAASMIAGMQPGSMATATHPSDNPATDNSAADSSPSDSGVQARGANPASSGSAEEAPSSGRGLLTPCSPGPPYTSLPCLPVQR